ncbi:MAG: ATP-binding protein [Isosphaeraceae bacterium]
MSDALTPPPSPAFDDDYVTQALEYDESYTFDCKRIKGKLDSVLETVVAFANSEGGTIALGLEDPDKASGRDRVFGIQENLMNWDEIRRLLRNRIIDPEDLPCQFKEIGCTLRDGARGSVVFLSVSKSRRIHSIVGNGTWVRFGKSNRQLTAPEIVDLGFARGTASAETLLEDIGFELLDTEFWRSYAARRRLTRPIDQAMFHLGLARKDDRGHLRPIRAAVLLFAEEPSGLLAGKASIRIFHYRGSRVATDPNTNLLKQPISINGPIIRQIQLAHDQVVSELASGIQKGPLGFEVVQDYPIRVINEAITNAVIHRDYRLNADIHVRIFADRIEVESPGLLIGPVTVGNISRIGTYARNPHIVNHLREFPTPPNLDAGEGVRMMFGTMKEAGLYPPQYFTRPRIEREAVVVNLLNDHRPSIWEQVTDYLDRHGAIGNAEVREIMGTPDTLAATKKLRDWVNHGLLIVVNPSGAKQYRKYARPDSESPGTLFSQLFGNQEDGK